MASTLYYIPFLRKERFEILKLIEKGTFQNQSIFSNTALNHTTIYHSVKEFKKLGLIEYRKIKSKNRKKLILTDKGREVLNYLIKIAENCNVI